MKWMNGDSWLTVERAGAGAAAEHQLHDLPVHRGVVHQQHPHHPLHASSFHLNKELPLSKQQQLAASTTSGKDTRIATTASCFTEWGHRGAPRMPF